MVRRGLGVRSFVVAAACVLLSAPLAFGQANAAQPGAAGRDAAPPEYDGVAVKAGQPGGQMMMMGVRAMPDGIDGDYVTVFMLVCMAYGGFMKLPSDDSVIGLPDWAKTD